MNRQLLILLLLSSVATCSAADGLVKPVVYNHVSSESAAVEILVNTALSPKFKLVDIPDSPDYVPPKPTAGYLPRAARTEEGKPLSGYVLVAYVVTAAGRVASPVVIKTTDQRLNAIALKGMKDWRFAPATFQGTAIATTAAQDFNFETAPTEYVPQILDPAGGRISRPTKWFYKTDHQGSTYRWTISREDTTGGKPYTTGVRIQTIIGVKDAMGKTARDSILDFVAAKKEEATKVIKTCEEKSQGLFTRICLETEEGQDHILYSLFWGTGDLDVAVITSARTAKDLWETYAPTFDKMSGFEVIDMKRFEK